MNAVSIRNFLQWHLMFAVLAYVALGAHYGSADPQQIFDAASVSASSVIGSNMLASFTDFVGWASDTDSRFTF